MSRFLAVPLRSSRFGSSIVSIRVGTKSFNKRLMSNAATPLSINNTKGKEMKAAAAATDHNSHQMVGATVVIDQFLLLLIALVLLLVLFRMIKRKLRR